MRHCAGWEIRVGHHPPKAAIGSRTREKGNIHDNAYPTSSDKIGAPRQWGYATCLVPFFRRLVRYFAICHCDPQSCEVGRPHICCFGQPDISGQFAVGP